MSAIYRQKRYCQDIGISDVDLLLNCASISCERGRVPHLGAMQDTKRMSGPIAHAVEETVARLRGEALARGDKERERPQPRPSAGPDLAELERELAALEARLSSCHRNLAKATRGRDSKTRFIEQSEKRATALREAIRRLKENA